MESSVTVTGLDCRSPDVIAQEMAYNSALYLQYSQLKDLYDLLTYTGDHDKCLLYRRLIEGHEDAIIQLKEEMKNLGLKDTTTKIFIKENK